MWIFTFIALLFGGSASANTEEIQPRIELLTDAPVQLGLGAVIEGPHRLRLTTSLGWMPESYIQTINAVSTSLGAGYTEANATLVESTIKNSLVWSTRIGWRPFAARGFYFHGGYTFAGLGGGATTQELIEGLTGVTAEERQTPQQRSGQEPLYIDAAATLHLVSLELGWEWTLWESVEEANAHEVILRTGLGWSYTFAATAELKSRSDSNRPFVEESLRRLEAAGEEYLIDLSKTYLHPPSITLAIGYLW